jgi:hypothetical protein
MRTAILLCVLALSACTDPSLTAGFAIGTNGVSVAPIVSGKVGGATVSVSP